jgi:hypothetical protein
MIFFKIRGASKKILKAMLKTSAVLMLAFLARFSVIIKKPTVITHSSLSLVTSSQAMY